MKPSFGQADQIFHALKNCMAALLLNLERLTRFDDGAGGDSESANRMEKLILEMSQLTDRLKKTLAEHNEQNYS